MSPLLWCFLHPEKTQVWKYSPLNTIKQKKIQIEYILSSSKCCSSLHPSTLASVVLFEYSGCDGKQLFDLREAWTLGDAYYGSLTCIGSLYCCSLLPFSVCHCTLLHLVVVVNVSLLLCCCTFDALVLSGSTGDKCSLYWNVQALQ